MRPSTIRLASLLLFGATTSGFADDEATIAAARKEGVAVWYTTQIITQLAQPAADAFQKKYGVKAQPVRGDASEVTLRIINEAKAGQVQADVVMQWQPDIAKSFKPQYRDKDGFWTATNLYVIAPSFNTDLVKRGTEPKTWADLLDPRYKGKMAVSAGASTSGGAGLTGAILHDMGQDKGLEYLKKLADQKVTLIASSARTVTDQVMQGEYAIGLMMSNNQPVSSAKLGAPVDTLPWSSSLSPISAIGVLKDAPHPNAGKLLLEFLVSPEGQRLFDKADYLPVNPDVPSSEPRLTPEGGNFSTIYLTPEEVDDKIRDWDKVFKGLFK